MKSKLDHVFLILGLFLFKVVVIDHFRFAGNNSDAAQVASLPKKNITLATTR